MNDIEAASEDLTKVIKADPEPAVAHYYRATALYELGELQATKDDLELARAGNLSPDLQEAAQSLLDQVDQDLAPPAPPTGQTIKGVPIMPDGTEIGSTSSGGYFTISRSLAEIQGWYNRQLPAYGWQQSQADYRRRGNQTVILAYTRGDQLAVIAGKILSDRTAVMIVVLPQDVAIPDLLHTTGFLCSIGG